ncbi:MAG TPA: SRPBCC domain-containing protein [Terracidiphilus sp.]|nr:SRPBCC domain-containing protein [Terracidiphilus sp.]
MNTTMQSNTIVQEIAIKGSAERIFAALTDRQERMKWWGGPGGRFRITQFESDLRPGGKWIMYAESIDSRPVTIRGEYREIDRPRLLVFTWLPDWYENATESLVRWDLDERDGVTTVRLTHSGLATEASRVSHRGWPQILAWLQGYIE